MIDRRHAGLRTGQRATKDRAWSSMGVHTRPLSLSLSPVSETVRSPVTSWPLWPAAYSGEAATLGFLSVGGLLIDHGIVRKLTLGAGADAVMSARTVVDYAVDHWRTGTPPMRPVVDA